MQIELITHPHQLNRIIPSWKLLLKVSEARDFFLQPEWLLAWHKIFGVPNDLFFILIYEGAQLLALFPLVKKRRGLLKEICFAGAPVTDRMDLLIAPGHEDRCLSVFMQWICRRKDWDLLLLRSFGAFSENPGRLRSAAAMSGKRTWMKPEPPMFLIDALKYNGFDDFLTQRRGKKSLNKIMQLRRKLDRDDPSSWTKYTELDDGLLNEINELDRNRSTRGKSGRSFFCNPLNRNFLEELSKRLAGTGSLEILTCRKGGELCAYELFFKDNDRWMGYQCAFDERYGKCSLGRISQIESFRHFFSHDVRIFDFLLGDEQYKQEWADSQLRLTRAFIFRGGIISFWTYFFYKYLKPFAKRIRARTGKKGFGG